MNLRTWTVMLLPGAALATAALAVDSQPIGVVREVKGDAAGKPHYQANRGPLLPSPFIKLPIGSIRPKGWLRQQLVLEAKGRTGHLPEISKWCKFESNAWASVEGLGQYGWEELP